MVSDEVTRKLDDIVKRLAKISADFHEAIWTAKNAVSQAESEFIEIREEHKRKRDHYSKRGEQ